MYISVCSIWSWIYITVYYSYRIYYIIHYKFIYIYTRSVKEKPLENSPCQRIRREIWCAVVFPMKTSKLFDTYPSRLLWDLPLSTACVYVFFYDEMKRIPHVYNQYHIIGTIHFIVLRIIIVVDVRIKPFRHETHRADIIIMYFIVRTRWSHFVPSDGVRH